MAPRSAPSVVPRRPVPHGGTEMRRLLRTDPPADPAPAPPAPRWTPAAWPLHLVVGLVLIGVVRAATLEAAPDGRAAALPDAAMAAPAGCARRAVTRGSIRFEAPPAC